MAVSNTFNQILGINEENSTYGAGFAPDVPGMPSKSKVAVAMAQQQQAQQDPTQQPQTQTPQPQTAPQTVEKTGVNPESPETPQKSLSYADLYMAMNPNKAETPEEKARREKREKRDKVFSAISDGISALSNLFYTTRYAPNMYDHTKSLSNKARERWERIKAQKDAENRDWFNGYMRALQLDDAKDKDERAWQNTLERQAKQDEKDAKAEERAAAKEQRDADLADLNMQLMAGKIDAQQWDAEKKRIEAQYAPQLQEAELKRKKAQTNASNASAGASSARAEYYRNGGSGSKKSKISLELEDGIEEYETSENYKQAVIDWAKEYKIPLKEVQVTERNWKGEPKKQHTVDRKIEDIASDVVREARKRREAKNKKKDEVIDYTPSSGDDDVIEYTPGK